MVRIMIKGGVWKNTEDEILKAAVMKYGKMSWARVASLLSRKSAKQCKARWFEWLDPAIKKTDWTRDEEEKLLHLAKLMPNQWRTIAPIVGRTAAQCLEHYERLLDMAQEKEGDVDASEARRLRPGEIDPAPETKPARPDPVDMDEDEKEMLQEARARLANTRGKKAKRKAREKQLEEARRLATLQKRRELKAAGIEHTMRQRKRKNIDYGREIPFQTTAPAGFYDTAAEKDAAKRAKSDPKFSAEYMHKMEEKRRDKEEEEQRKRDSQKLKKMMKANLPQQIMALSKLNDPIPVRKRLPLALPSPQVTDAELEDIVKMGSLSSASGGTEITAGLTGDYKLDKSIGTPLRTPATPAGSDIIMQEARNMAALNAAQTPLLGEINASIEEGTGFAGSAPRSSKIASTPHAFMTPIGSESTPSRFSSGDRGETPIRSVLRDQFGLNKDSGKEYMLTPAGSTSSRISKMEKVKARQAQAEITMQIQGLPAPQFTYEISLPETGDEPDTKVVLEEDAAEQDKYLQDLRILEQEAEWRARTQVLKKDLPRPVVVNHDIPLLENSVFSKAEEVINAECLTLLLHDSSKYPVATTAAADGKKKLKKKKMNKNNGYGAANDNIELTKYSEEELMNVSLLIQEELAQISKQDTADIWETWEANHKNWAFIPNNNSYGELSSVDDYTKIVTYMYEYNLLRTAIDRLAAKADKAEARIALTQGGYSKRAQSMVDSIISSHGVIDTATIELACYQKLWSNELLALPRRINEAKVALKEEEIIEARLQNEYAILMNELREADATPMDVTMMPDEHVPESKESVSVQSST